ncbi:flagellar export chaperone FlgN [Actinokineospora auranticolor]|uniref:FlgN protein n=1 Tax=Actinokineospora auranticolor TaxID=155976 RepID=A0A2S6GMK9_9PSEU|nr:flagellar export chaperone FlgN [Actinokineospora auranticolor]PPK66468.1 FlgN protein [Actinokineospora auranticolor]
MNPVETSAILWRQRELLSLLLFKLEVESLLLAAGRTRWLGSATYEVELMLERIQNTELLRAAAVDELAESLGLLPGPSLAALTDALDDPWKSVFSEHRTALATLSAEIEAAVEANRDLLTSGRRAVADALRVVRGDATGDTLYRADGSTAPAAVGARLVDEAL